MAFMLLYAWLTSPESEMGLVRSVPASAASSANPRKAVLHKAGRPAPLAQERTSTIVNTRKKKGFKKRSNGYETEIMWRNAVKKRSER